ncbi:RagB/SusD family nutrient uptake outer membrane protein [Xanthovirga aplysinae]|uniref:RagB/SusD family nutrient uptake outer membrane protein n=1 Tax=Xanthovirga aplysinae TaxID=2529853 RepID=UPI0012BC54F7|nr:RagB/SusD family nutrient uptake outer membrane protein [Xanthovirga aplysinae]MTI33255.1 RagB/SusD family nutrient uptake outer membrane protein [Xanthovirga aplysinae]
MRLNKYRIMFLSLFLIGQSCSDLEEDILDQVLNQDILNNADAADNLLAATYGAVRSGWGKTREFWMFTELTTDEAIIPFRGRIHFGNPHWQPMHTHTWTPLTNRTSEIWETLHRPFERALVLESEIQNLKVEQSVIDQYVAEAKGVSAISQYYALNWYDQMPIREGNETKYLRGEEACDFLISRITEIIPDLPSISDYGPNRFNKEAAMALLMRVYLNRAVFNNRYASGFNFSQEDMQQVLHYANILINSGNNALETEDYFKIFDIDNHNHPEHIFSINQNGGNGLQDIIWISTSRARFGSLVNLAARGGDGASITPEFWHSWEGNHEDPRFSKIIIPQDGSVTQISDEEWGQNRGLIAGPQYGVRFNEEQSGLERTASGDLVIAPLFNFETDNERVIHSVEVDFEAFSGHNNGIRVAKYQWDPEAPDDGRSYSRMDIPLFRLGDVYLMRAEANLRMGNTALALQDLNTLRTARKHPVLLAEIDEEVLLRERGFEMYWEHVRRTDMIRFGKFEEAYTEKGVSETYRRVFPIPASILNATKEGLLQQNEGY